jgi:hypothetical protein
MEKQRKYVPLQVVMLSIDSVGGEGKVHNVLVALREITGVRGAGLFFSNTTVRIYYDPECTDLEIIFAALLPLKDGFKDETIHQDAFAGSVVGR